MRRVFAIASLSALLVFLPHAFPQRGGHSAGFSGGHAGGSIGHFGGGGFSAGSFGRSSSFSPRSFATAPRFTSTAPNRAFVPGYRTPYGAGIVTRRREDYRYRSPYRGSGYGGYPYGYANSWELLPWDIGYPDFTGYDNDPGEDTQQPAASVAPPDDGYRPDYAEPPDQGYPYAAPAGPSVPTLAASEPQLTLIFNDGHQETIRNYVLTANTVVVLDQAASGYQKRIPLASLNLPATEQAAQQAGLDFTPPA